MRLGNWRRDCSSHRRPGRSRELADLAAKWDAGRANSTGRAIMKHGISTVAFLLMSSLPSLAGETQYTGPGSNPQVLSAERACEPKIGQANDAFARMRLQAGDP